MKEAIELAVKGGYDLKKGVKWPERLSSWPELEEVAHKMYPELIREDPLFWKALGKQQGWCDDQEIQFTLPVGDEARMKAVVHVENDLGVVVKVLDDRLVYLPYTRGKPTWKQAWHSFIDALIEGQTPDEFFARLLDNPNTP